MTIEEAIVQLKELRKCEKYLYPSDIKAIDIALEHMDLYGTYISMNMHNKLYKKQKSINYELVDENQKLINENKELKRLLKLAVNDFEVYPNAFVQKNDTVSNIVDIYNLVDYSSTSSGIRGYAEILNGWDFAHNTLDTMALEDNKLYEC